MTETLFITVLVEDTVSTAQLAPGHGLALLIECGEDRVLFDTGPDDTVVRNAAALGISLSPLTAVVLSHGHYDHTGGLSAVLATVGKVPVIAHPDLFGERYARDAAGTLRSIGPPLSRDEYERQGARFELDAGSRPVGNGLLTTGEVPQPAGPPPADSRLLRRGANGIQPDGFRDDLSLVALLDDCSVVMTGCAHAGASNILRRLEAVAPGRSPRVVLGGLHLLAASDESVAAVADEAHARGVRALLPCHCTGRRAIGILQAEFPGTVLPLTAGTQIRIDQDGSPTLTSCLRAQ